MNDYCTQSAYLCLDQPSWRRSWRRTWRRTWRPSPPCRPCRDERSVQHADAGLRNAARTIRSIRPGRRSAAATAAAAATSTLPVAVPSIVCSKSVTLFAFSLELLRRLRKRVWIWWRWIRRWIWQWILLETLRWSTALTLVVLLVKERCI